MEKFVYQLSRFLVNCRQPRDIIGHAFIQKNSLFCKLCQICIWTGRRFGVYSAHFNRLYVFEVGGIGLSRGEIIKGVMNEVG